MMYDTLPPYTAPAQTRIGHVHLKVADLQRSIAFYRDLLGFELTLWYGDEAAFLSAGGYHHHIGINIWYSRNAPPPHCIRLDCIILPSFIPRGKTWP